MFLLLHITVMATHERVKLPQQTAGSAGCGGLVVCVCMTAAYPRHKRGVRRLSDGEKMDSMSLLLYMAPVAALALVPAAVILEPQSIQAARDLSVEHPCKSSPDPKNLTHMLTAIPNSSTKP